jgi:hypothetical protein
MVKGMWFSSLLFIMLLSCEFIISLSLDMAFKLTIMSIILTIGICTMFIGYGIIEKEFEYFKNLEVRIHTLEKNMERET